MATRTQKMKVGVFLLLFGSLIVVGVLTILGYNTETESTYYILFDENILGLGVGGLVEFKGVPVGSVENIYVDRENHARVQIKVSDEKVTLREGVTAELRIYSFATGSMVVSLEGGALDQPILAPNSIIPTRDSLLTNITSVVEEALSNISNIANDLEGALEGLEDGGITRLVENINGMVSDARQVLTSVSDTIASLDEDVEGAIQEYTALATDARGVVKNVEGMTENASALMATAREKIEPLDVEAMQEDLRQALKRANDIMADLQETVKSVNAAGDAVTYDVDTLQRSLRGTMRSLTETLDTVDGIAKQVQDDPTSIVRGKSNARKELP